MHCRRHLPSPHQKRVVFCCCKITFFFCYCVNVCEFLYCFFLGTTCVLMCGLCVLFYCVCNYALLLCCCCCCFYFVCFLCFERVIAFRWENMPKNGTKYALVLLFFCRSEWLFVCACVCGWVCKLILVILIDLLQAGFCFLAITKKSYKQNYKSRQKANDLCCQRQRSWRRRKCGQAAVFVSLCVCVSVQSKRQNWKNQAQYVTVCVCVYLFVVVAAPHGA